ncbi:CinA family nicotinamide mononucleotide deamidase-related protein [Elizabethkingia anophelis]|uniref:CinA-like protein n=1 Tax=Elizabethkingia anophelis TaxID=1117645 RepID=A0A7Z7LY93_9FLAO|nr:CinA family nicotinamide mononucleotide deamidase-related protein [Elizabethkingia anophelis]MCT3628607.1 CinA family nicotinamide mononucleotide deamidase-related protein [Elizabethkingia anophelis]MCT3632455.1 CinA family nicotinamide mononucleotide deamidase-related protein [Elizabethkingia anophelis]MCT3720277.1 CinA family nicotinamide mononucleotide deamidase-related protein [Elizabethkingia anophelis]MCT3723787.1 CinA family nicotinamide mononucleotide deamidase-related protein [Eliza
MKTATIITIGDEILSGNTVDTNSNFIAQQLKDIGIKVQQIFTISDEICEIETFLRIALENSDLVITTGGLGPTKDDKTKKAYASFFHDELVFSEELYEKLGKYLEKRGRLELLERNRNQCEVLSKATIFDNHYGTAPCQMMEQNGKFTFCLPGVPFEVKPLIKDQIIPYLKQKWELSFIHTRIISVVGVPESLLSDTIEDWELALPENVSLSYLPVGTRVKLRLTGTGQSQARLEEQLEQLIQPLKPLIAKNVIAWSEDAIENILASILFDKELTISTAESCTTGQVARLLTSVSGSSSYYKGGIIPYFTEMKSQLLQISESIIKEHTVVSEEVAIEMAKSCQKLFSSDIAISSTGVSGPNKGEDGKDVGTVYYAIAKGDEVRAFHLFLPGFERNDFVNFISQKIIETLIVWLEER